MAGLKSGGEKLSLLDVISGFLEDATLATAIAIQYIDDNRLLANSPEFQMNLTKG
jgi:hypothetical protein